MKSGEGYGNILTCHSSPLPGLPSQSRVAGPRRCSELLLGSTHNSTLGSTLEPSILCHSIPMLPVRTPTRGLLSPHLCDRAREQSGRPFGNTHSSALAPSFSPFPLTLPGSPLAQGPLKALKHLLAHRKLTHACPTPPPPPWWGNKLPTAGQCFCPSLKKINLNHI